MTFRKILSVVLATLCLLSSSAPAFAGPVIPNNRPSTCYGAFFNSADTAFKFTTSLDANCDVFRDVGAYYDPYPDKVVRDPSIMVRGSDIYLAYTNGGSASIATSSFSLAKSSDRGITWTRIGAVDMSSVSGSGATARVWAPEWFVDVDGSVHIVVAVSNNNASTFKIYETHPTDPSDYTAPWSSPVQITGSISDVGTGIDASISYADGIYRLFYKNTYTEEATSTSPFSGYNTGTGNTDQNMWGTGNEGPSQLYNPYTGRLRVFVDNTLGGGQGVGYFDRVGSGPWTVPITYVQISGFENGNNLAQAYDSASGSFQSTLNWRYKTTSSSGLTISNGPTDYSNTGAKTAYTITADGSAFAQNVQLNVGSLVNDSAYYCYAVFIKKTAGATRFPALDLLFSGGTTVEYGMVVNTNTGVSYAGSWGTAPVAHGVVDYGTYWRAWMKVANNGTGNTTAQLLFGPAWNNTGNSGTRGTYSGSAIVWGRSLVKQDTCPDAYSSNIPNSVRPNAVGHGTVIWGQ